MPRFEPERPKRLAAAVVVVAIFAFHVTAVAVFLMPDNPIKKGLPTMTGYVTRYFMQNWHLFSPNPKIDSLDLWVECTDSNGNTTPWLDPLDSMTQRAHTTPFGPYQKLAFVYNGVVDNFARAFSIAYTAGCPDGQGDASDEARIQCAQALLRESYEYDEAVRFARKACRDADAPEPAQIRLRLARTIPVAWEERATVTSRLWTPSEFYDLDPVVMP